MAPPGRGVGFAVLVGDGGRDIAVGVAGIRPRFPNKIDINDFWKIST